MPSSRLRDTARKRPLEVELQETCLVDSISSDADTTPAIRRLSLEAIFHPKFENENRSSQEIRKAMIQKIKASNDKQGGYLEVSLKHSGTLVLWSGGQRYYSKNSTGNAFTAICEVLLRQHYARLGHEGENNTDYYQNCSNYIQQQRLTLAFECVTAVLGHHGDIPHRDFLILTAVAERKRQRFLTTVEIIQFAQQFKLPHNDVWVFATPQSVDQLFHIHDTTRETGLAQDTIAALDASAEVHVSSMYPHAVFQGDILEGIVIRYVPSDTAFQDLSGLWAGLVKTSQQALTKVPPCTPATFETKQESPLLRTDIRRLQQQCIDNGGYENLISRLGDAVANILLETDGLRRKIEKRKQAEWDMPSLARKMLVCEHVDQETKRIATVIETATRINARVEYSIFKENESRWLCMIHILHDQTFRKYQQQMKSNDMQLYRGFCIELGTDLGKKETIIGGDVTEMDIDAPDSNQDASLMLKMKFLPYMVRTFCCRNGLGIIANKGPAAFTHHTLKMMDQWGISQTSQLKWQPFFWAWGSYANACLQGLSKIYFNPKLPPLTEQFYLSHLQYFTPLFEDGKIDLESECPSKYAQSTFRALVIVVALTVEASEKVADYIAMQLGGVKRVNNIQDLSDNDLIMMKAAKGGGLICSCDLKNGFKSMKPRTKKQSDSISVIIYGCNKENIDATMLPVETKRLLHGMYKAWKKFRCKYVDEISEGVDLEASHDLSRVISKLTEVSESVPKVDDRPGMLIFFPGIPGSGKSSLCNVDVISKLNELNNSSSTSDHRQVVLLRGDSFGKKYWNHIKEMRTLNSASIYIADKNAPASSWGTVGEATCRGINVPVIPDEQALSTTSVSGIRYPNGETNSLKNHTYPFSLFYLAVCIERVLARTPSSHPGNLDSASATPCMIVVKFFSFYRNIAADEFVDNIRRRIDGSGAISTSIPIKVPFFKVGLLPNLPEDLKQALTEAIQLQYGYDIMKDNASNSSDELVMETESMLQKTVEIHRDLLVSLTANFDVSQASFIQQVVEHAKELDTQPNEFSESLNRLPAIFIKIVSLDILAIQVHEVVKMNYSALSSFFQMVALSDSEVLSEGKFSSSDFVPKTHVTMVHFSEMLQSSIQHSYNHLVGKGVELKLLGLLWNDQVAALAVDVASETIDGIPVPPPSNAFAHISLWCRKNVKPVESNNLPKLVCDGMAQQVDFKQTATLQGTLSFWSMNEQSQNQ